MAASVLQCKLQKPFFRYTWKEPFHVCRRCSPLPLFASSLSSTTHQDAAGNPQGKTPKEGLSSFLASHRLLLLSLPMVMLLSPVIALLSTSLHEQELWKQWEKTAGRTGLRLFAPEALKTNDSTGVVISFGVVSVANVVVGDSVEDEFWINN